ncbi:MAG: helicase-related protein [Candidatus Heimdallarchaeota archaeon]
MESSSSAPAKVTPRPYQQEVLRALQDHPKRNQIVHLAFGAGKTLVALWEMIRRRQSSPTKKIVYVSAGEGGYDRARQALDMAIQFGLQAHLGFCLDPKSMLDRVGRRRKKTAWQEANVIFGPLQAVWNSLERDFPAIQESIDFFVIDEVADIVSRDLAGWRFHKSVAPLMAFLKENSIPILGLTGSLSSSRLNAITRMIGGILHTRPDIQPFAYEYSTIMVQDQAVQRLDSLFGAGLSECTRKASALLEHPLTVELMYELLYGGLLGKLYQAKPSLESGLLEKIQSPEERNVLSQILRDFHLYAHGRVIALNSTPAHLVNFVKKYSFPAQMKFSLTETAAARWERTAMASKVLRTVIPIREASKKYPVIVFGRFLDLVDQCEKVLVANGVAARQLTGKTKPPSRRTILQEFREGEYPVLILSPLGTRGLDLPEVGLVVHLDITQSVDIIAQRSARIRGGQVWFTICAETSEEGKLRLLEKGLGASTHYIPPLSPMQKERTPIGEKEDLTESKQLTDKQKELLEWYEPPKGE